MIIVLKLFIIYIGLHIYKYLYFFNYIVLRNIFHVNIEFQFNTFLHKYRLCRPISIQQYRMYYIYILQL